MEKYWSEEFFNASAIYEEGARVRKDVEKNRSEIARILGIKKAEIVFTSGGTEANNLAVLGVFEAARSPLDQSRPISHPHLIISSIEHSSIREVAQEVIRRGGEVSIAEADEKGYVHFETVKKLIKSNTVLISIMLANNEIGVLEPVARIGRVVHEARKENGNKYPLFHTDASQAANYFDVNLEKLNVDFLTLDGSKIYGPKGVGLLATRSTSVLRPIIFGGGQEANLRGGTESPALVTGFAVALQAAERDKEKETKRLLELKQIFIAELERLAPQVQILSSLEEALPNIVAVQLPEEMLSELIVLNMDKQGIAVSSGSACLNLSGKPNESLIRFSLGRRTSKSEIEKTAKVFTQIINHDKIIP